MGKATLTARDARAKHRRPNETRDRLSAMEERGNLTALELGALSIEWTEVSRGYRALSDFYMKRAQRWLTVALAFGLLSAAFSLVVAVIS